MQIVRTSANFHRAHAEGAGAAKQAALEARHEDALFAAMAEEALVAPPVVRAALDELDFTGIVSVERFVNAARGDLGVEGAITLRR